MSSKLEGPVPSCGYKSIVKYLLITFIQNTHFFDSIHLSKTNIVSVFTYVSCITKKKLFLEIIDQWLQQDWCLRSLLSIVVVVVVRLNLTKKETPKFYC